MLKQKPEFLVRDIFSTSADEIQCDEAQLQIARSTEDLLSDGESQQQFPALWQHFEFCTDCAAEYQLVLKLAQLENSQQLERPLRLPSLPVMQEPVVWNTVVRLLTLHFPGFEPALAQTIQRGQDMLSELSLLKTEDGALDITLDIAPHEPDATLRDLFCTVQVNTSDNLGIIEGTPVWLQETCGAVLYEKVLDTWGGVVFRGVTSGKYELSIYWAKQEYRIVDLIIP